MLSRPFTQSYRSLLWIVTRHQCVFPTQTIVPGLIVGCLDNLFDSGQALVHIFLSQQTERQKHLPPCSSLVRRLTRIGNSQIVGQKWPFPLWALCVVGPKPREGM